MKFNIKGQFKFDQYLYEYSAYVSGLRTNAPTPLEFDPSDFKDTIVLTVEEAEEFEVMTYDFLETFEKHFDVPEWNHYVKLYQLLKERIEKAEIKRLKREIAQLKEYQARDNYYLQQFLKNVKQVEKEKQCKLTEKTLI